MQETVAEGVFKAETKWCLRIAPTTLDIDMIVLTFVIMEKRRRDRVAADGMKDQDFTDDEIAEGACEVGGLGG